MITQITLRNFRNFSHICLDWLQEKNYITGENGKGKTNILEAISVLCNHSLSGIPIDEMVQSQQDVFFIELSHHTLWNISISYDKVNKKKKYFVNGKSTTKKKLSLESYKCVCFTPIIMNMLYLSPGLRRDFLDTVLSSSFDSYKWLLSSYKIILKHRNKMLKNIAENKSSIDEIHFWDEKFMQTASEIYTYRLKLMDFLSWSIESCKQYFSGKIDTIELLYISKIDPKDPADSIRKYLQKNIARDTILWKTPIGPHVDDFEIRTNGVLLTHFASRGETKSIIIWLKLLEAVFIEKMTGKKPILLIDDLLSELDNAHKDMLLEKISYYQTFITSISEIGEKNNIKI